MGTDRNIAIVASKQYGINGVATASWNLASILADAGYRISFITSPNFLYARTANNRNINIICLKHRLSLKSIQWSLQQRMSFLPLGDIDPLDIDIVKYALSLSLSLPSIITKYKIDTVIFSDSFQESLYLPRLGCRKITWFQCPRYLFQKIGLSASPVNSYLMKKDILSVASSDLFLSPSKATARLASEYFKIDLSAIGILPNPVDLTLFHPSATSGESDIVNICFAGRFTKEKGANIIIRTIPMLIRELPNVRFTVAGSDSSDSSGVSYISLLKENLKNAGCLDKFSWHPCIPYQEMPDFYRNSSILVSPTLFDSCSMSIIEAQACGLPVVISNVGGNPEIIQDGKTGFLIHLNDEVGFYRSLKELASNSVIRNSMGRNAHEFASNKFGFKGIIEEFNRYLHP